jgi:hypothetical protein
MELPTKQKIKKKKKKKIEIDCMFDRGVSPTLTNNGV